MVAKHCDVLGGWVHAFLRLRDGATNETELKLFCAQRLADCKVPEAFTILDDAFPKNAAGKILKSAARKLQRIPLTLVKSSSKYSEDSSSGSSGRPV